VFRDTGEILPKKITRSEFVPTLRPQMSRRSATVASLRPFGRRAGTSLASMFATLNSVGGSFTVQVISDGRTPAEVAHLDLDSVAGAYDAHYCEFRV